LLDLLSDPENARRDNHCQKMLTSHVRGGSHGDKQVLEQKRLEPKWLQYSSFSVYNNAIKREVMSATSIDGLFALERLKNNNHSWGVPHLGVSPVVLKTRNREPPL
jgi:hypothetical protein